ncbi:MAG: hypothetical protein IJS82_01165 [Paludibacteraceae bacterium]|nr:hypothetical protein [Paludibacteraceae bacterium]
MKKLFLLLAAVFTMSQFVAADSYTFTSGTTIKIDFRDVSGGANFTYANYASAGDYDASVGGTVKEITFSTDVEWTVGATFIKTATGGWAEIPFVAPADGQLVAEVSCNGKSFTWKDALSEEYTFTSGTTIYYDLTGYTGGGFNDFNNGWHADVSNIIPITLTSDWTIREASPIIKSNATGWDFYGAGSLPTDGQNMIISTDGATITWGTYTVPAVDFVGVGTNIGLNQDIQLNATSNNINGNGVAATSYKFYIKQGEGEYSEITAGHYQFAAAGSYTAKVEALNSSEVVKAEKEQEITVVDGTIIYFVNSKGWAQANAHLYVDGGISTTWPGETMSLTTATTTRNSYPVYSAVYTAAYETVIFNGTTELSAVALDADKRYYYEGDWFATLAECDVPQLNTTFYLAGDFNEWSTTANRFVKATEDATEASTTVSITTAGDRQFKVVDNGEWRGAEDDVTLTKDAKTVTILSAAAGNNITITPYAGGDYIFTLNLDTRVLTVTYPEGSPLVPTAIDEINANSKSLKFFKDGQLLIKRDGKVVNVLGQTIR